MNQISMMMTILMILIELIVKNYTVHGIFLLLSILSCSFWNKQCYNSLILKPPKIVFKILFINTCMFLHSYICKV